MLFNMSIWYFVTGSGTPFPALRNCCDELVALKRGLSEVGNDALVNWCLTNLLSLFP